MALLLVLHGSVVRWPFLSDDFIFLAASRRLSQMFTSFDAYSNYFRPIGRELYFFVGQLIAGNHPLPYHLFNFAVLLGIVALVMGLGNRFAGPRAGLLAGLAYVLLYSHRLLLAWVSCSQDLLATMFALLAAHALTTERRWRAGAWYLAALFSKESVASFALVYLLWSWLGATAGSPWRTRAEGALRRSAPLWCATAVWVAIVVAVRTVRHAWATGASTPLADVSLSLEALWEGMRSAILSYVSLEQPWGFLGPALVGLRHQWLPLSAAVVGVLVLTLLSRRFAAPRQTWRDADGMATLGILWATVGAVPVALAGHHFSAYYVTFSGVGFALIVGRALVMVPPLALFGWLATTLTLGLAANRVELYNFARTDPVAGASSVTISRLNHERVFLDSLRVALMRIRPPRGSVVYVTYAPRYTTFATMRGSALRVWFDDPDLDLKMIGEYKAPEIRPHVFIRFDSARRSFLHIPNGPMDAELAAETLMNDKRPAEARAHLEAALRMLPPSRELDTVRLDVLNNLGFACAAMGDTARARRSWLDALAIDSTFESAALNLARLDAVAGRLSSAREHLERLLRASPDVSEALSMLVRIERAQGDLAAAQMTWERLSVVSPVEAAALQRLLAEPMSAPPHVR